MSTCRSVVTNALKLAKVTRNPTSAEAADGLTCLQSLYDQWVHNGFFGRLEDVYLDANETALEGKRYFVPTGYTLTAPSSVYVAEDGTTRQPRDLALYESLTQAGTRAVKLYDRTAWVDLTGLTLDSTAPLSSRGEIGLAAALACSGGFVAMFSPPEAYLPALQMLSANWLTGIMGRAGSTQDMPAAVFY